MIYFAIQDEAGRYWDGSSKMVRPPILLTTENVKSARVTRIKSEAEGWIRKAANYERFHVCELDSREHSHLAD